MTPASAVDQELAWHYTDAAGFAGIISENQLWATQMPMLNDLTELQYGCDQISALLLSELDKSSGAPESWPIDELVRAIKPEVTRTNVCVASASTDGDLLNQWMHYGSGGYAIGFDTSQVLGVLVDNSTVKRIKPGRILAFRWSKVSYGQNEMVREILPLLIDLVGKGDPPNHVETPAAVLHTLAAITKHPCFESERETRYIAPIDQAREGIQYRVVDGRLAAYLLLTGITQNPGKDEVRAARQKLPIRRVIVGPSQTQMRDVGTVSQFLADHGFASVEVDFSRLPYRSVGRR